MKTSRVIFEKVLSFEGTQYLYYFWEKDGALFLKTEEKQKGKTVFSHLISYPMGFREDLSRLLPICVQTLTPPRVLQEVLEENLSM